MLLVGLTGSISTGKSTVSRILSTELGIRVIDADLIARQVVEPGQPAYHKIIREFGPGILLTTDKDEEKLSSSSIGARINREKLGAMVFQDQATRKRLNSITHPYIRLELLKQTLHSFLTLEPVVVLDIPLLIESKLNRFVNKIVVVSCSTAHQKSRLLSRNPELTHEQAQQRIDAQISISEKMKHATHIIDNNGEKESTRQQVQLLFGKEFKRSMLWTAIGWTLLSIPASIAYLATLIIINM